MPVSAGSLYDYHDPFRGTQRNLDRFVDLYERKKERGLREKGLGLEERRVGLAERGEDLESRYKEMLIDTETEKLKMAQELRNNPAARVSIMSKAFKQANKMAGKEGVERLLKSFQANPQYQEDVTGYTADDFQFTEDGLLVTPVRNKSTGEPLEGMYGFTDENDKPHFLNMNKFKKEPVDKSESEFRQWSSQLNSLYNKRSSIRMGINPLTGIALPRTEVDAALADNEKMIKRVENRMKTQYPDQWETFGQEETEESIPAQAQPVTKKLDKETAKQFLDQAGGDKEKARELARQEGYEF